MNSIADVLKLKIRRILLAIISERRFLYSLHLRNKPYLQEGGFTITKLFT